MMRAGEYRNLVEYKIPEEDYPGFEFTTRKDVFKEAYGGQVKRIGLLTTKEDLPHYIMNILNGTNREIVDISDRLQGRGPKTELIGGIDDATKDVPWAKFALLKG